MPYESHPSLTPPADRNGWIWRYVSFEKLVAMLQDRSLFFSPVGDLADAFEGAIPQTTIDRIAGTSKQRRQDWLINFDNAKKLMRVNCWHENPFESAAMWEVYRAGIAIRSTFNRFVRALQETPEDVNLGMIRYIDYEQDDIPLENVFSALTSKRTSFEYERELRVIYFSDKSFGQGVTISVSLNDLVDAIVVSPFAAPWRVNVVKRLLNKYDLDKPVEQSSLSASPPG